MTLPTRKPSAMEGDEYDHIDLSITLCDPRKEFDIALDNDESLVEPTTMADFDPENVLNLESKEKEPDWDWICGCLLNITCLRCGVGNGRRAICPISTIFGRLFWSYYIRDSCGVTHVEVCVIHSHTIDSWVVGWSCCTCKTTSRM